MRVKFKKLSERAVTPQYAKPGDAGMDLVSTSVVENEMFYEYDTDIAVEIPEGYVGFLIEQKKSHKDWHKTIKKLVNDSERIKDMGEALYETVKEKYNLDFVSKNRMGFYKSVLK